MNTIRKKNYLTADANHPLITSGSFKTEALLYNLQAKAQQEVMDSFLRICGKQLELSSQVTDFSGGERVILMALMSLACPAPKLCFIDLWHALDPGKRLMLKKLIETSPKEILLEDSQC